MPIEMRVMMYNDQEVVSALAQYYRKTGRPLTVGTVKHYTINEADRVTVDLVIETIDGDLVDHPISETDLAAALIMDTLKRKIPLPADSDKRIYVIENHVTLIVHKPRNRGEPARPSAAIMPLR